MARLKQKIKTALFRFYLLLICGLLVSCTITAPEESVLNIRVINKTEINLESFWAYTITFGEVKPNDTSVLKFTNVPLSLYRSGSHHISFVVDDLSFRCYGQPLYDGIFTVIIEKNEANDLFLVTVQGDARSDSTTIYTTDLSDG